MASESPDTLDRHKGRPGRRRARQTPHLPRHMAALASKLVLVSRALGRVIPQAWSTSCVAVRSIMQADRSRRGMQSLR